MKSEKKGGLVEFHRPEIASELHVKTPLNEPVELLDIEDLYGFETLEDSDVVCRICKNKITKIEFMISVNGRHRHTFKNPTGLEFEIACYSQANGCLISGEPSMEYTWFPGFDWSFASCSQCMVHLGWFYEKRYESFLGLIRDRLEETSMSR